MRGTANLILPYMLKNSDRIVTIAELDEAFPDINRSTISNAIVTLKRQHPNQMLSVKQGQYKWLSTAPEVEQKQREFIVRIVEEDADRLLVMDDETNALFVMKRLEW